MYGGNKQGGGGSGFVSLTGLFRSAKGRVGSISPDAFQVIADVMDECAQKDVELMFFIADEDRDSNGKPNPRTAGRLYITVGKAKQERLQPQRKQWGNRGQRQAGGGYAAPQHTAQNERAAPTPRREFGSKKSNNPPKDELEEFLAKFDAPEE